MHQPGNSVYLSVPCRYLLKFKISPETLYFDIFTSLGGISNKIPELLGGTGIIGSKEIYVLYVPNVYKVCRL